MKPQVLAFLLLFFGNLIFAQLEGYGIEQYGNSIEHPFHSAYKIHQDSTDRLYINTSRKLDNLWTFHDGAFCNVQSSKSQKPILNEDGLKVIGLDPFNVQIIRGSDTIDIATKDYGLERQIYDVQSYPKEDVFRVHTHDGYLLMSKQTLTVIKCMFHDAQNIIHFHRNDDTLFYRGDECFFIVKDDKSTKSFYDLEKNICPIFIPLPSGELIPSTDRSLDISKKAMESLRYSPYQHYMLFEDQEGRIWSFHNQDGKRSLFIKNTYDAPWEVVTLNNDETVQVKTIFQDVYGDYWIGTVGQGVLHMYKKSITILDETWGLSAKNIISAFEDSNENIHITYNCHGIDVITKSGIKHFRNKECQTPQIHDHENNIWLSSRDVIKLDSNYNELSRFSKSDGMQSKTILLHFQDSSRRIWIGTRQCIHHINRDKVVKYCNPSLTVEDRFYNMVELENGHFLLANTNDKLYSFKNGKFTPFDSPNARISHLHRAINGTVWLATFDKGLFYLEDDKWSKVGSSGIPSSITFVQDGGQDLLFGLSQEQTLFYADQNILKSNDPQTKVNTLSYSDGIPLINSNGRQQPTTLRLGNGSVIFPNIHGAIWIDPESLLRKKKEYNLYVSINDTIHLEREVNLEFGSNDLSIKFHHTYLNPESSIQFSYSIDNEPYKSCESNLNLNNLSSGWHTLNYRSKHLNQDWYGEKTLNIFVPPLLYQRAWFWAIIIILFGLFINLLLKWRLKNIAERNKELSAKVEEQTHTINKEKEQLALSLENEKKLSHELKLTEQSKNRMYAQISHEFKSPLQAISSYLKKNRVIYDDQVKQNISKNIQNLLSISDEILELSKAQSGKLKAKKDYYNIHSVIKEQVQILDALVEDKNIQINLNFDTDTLYLSIDLNLIQKAITNLLSNAIKFSHMNGSIIVHSKQVGQKQRISIADTGVGIPKEEIEHLTTAYFQASNNVENGTGIGLSLVKEILKIHEANLDIKSELGKGSTFSFDLTLPSIPQEEIVQKYKSELQALDQIERFVNKQKPTILAVDDNIDVLRFITESLKMNYNVIQLTNAKEALSCITEINPKLIISDINMPIMGGFEFVKSIRAIPKYQSIPFVFLTGSMNEESELQGLKSGADVLLTKPIQSEKILTQIESIMSRYKIVSHSAQLSLTSTIIKDHVGEDEVELLKKVEQTILDQIKNPKLKSSDLALSLAIGEKTLRNKMKELTGFTIKEYLRKVRMENAEILIKEGKLTKGQIASALGFSSLSYFSKAYNDYQKKR